MDADGAGPRAAAAGQMVCAPGRLPSHARASIPGLILTVALRRGPHVAHGLAVRSGGGPWVPVLSVARRGTTRLPLSRK